MLNYNTLKSLILNRIYILTNSFIPTDNNISILCKGPSFVPKQKPCIKIIRAYINDFLRKIQWHKFFNNKIADKNNRFGYHKSSRWPSGKQVHPDTLKICNQIKYSCNTIMRNYIVSSSDVYLDSNSNAHFLVADKGSNWVICNPYLIKQEGTRQLHNNQFYAPLSTQRASLTASNINHFVNYLYDKKFINSSEKNFLLCPSNYRLRKLNLVPKTHKDVWSYPNYLPPCRPIIDNHKTESFNIAIFIDFFLQPLVLSLPSFIRDSFHFKSKISSIHFSSSFSLLTLDVESLYTNIPIEGAIEAVRELFRRHPDNSRPDNVIIKLIRIILCNNDFVFDNNLYLQTQGVSMGQRFAPSIANIYMGLWEEKLFQSCLIKPIYWFRYIDDIFAVWPHNKDLIPSFLSYANSIDHHIKLTSHSSNSIITFLDLDIYVSNNHLLTRIHFKPTNPHAILHRESNHPKHTFKGIIYSQVYRWAALNSTREDFLRTKNTVYPIWKSRGYTNTLIRSTERKVLANLNLKSSWKHGFFKCNKCSICTYCINSLSFTSSHKTFQIIGNYSCDSTNIIYLIKCAKCHLSYVGQTVNFYKRIHEHINAIKRHDPGTLYHHFNSCGIQYFNSFIIDHNNISDPTKKEILWIKKLNTTSPYGLNIIANKISIPRLVLPFNSLSQKIANNIKNICNLNNIETNLTFATENNLKKLLNYNKHTNTNTHTNTQL